MWLVCLNLQLLLLLHLLFSSFLPHHPPLHPRMCVSTLGVAGRRVKFAHSGRHYDVSTNSFSDSLSTSVVKSRDLILLTVHH
ncbi:hypothetical protein Pmani_014549 [Petrolisthes manimaculis]|uniref:Secreted protein n=1 Tax=Petrolisthes manimaculis TaxID=1843537 RepID=A0AAE1PVH6_9EUCA|nr:hypothetical protein Pmani_014549 [Petrolisthes manimaculis]